MRARAKLQPGQPGTKALMKIYGDRLVCVRYRYDRERQKRYKTVELIVDEAEWEAPCQVPDPETRVYVRVAWAKRPLRAASKKRVVSGIGPISSGRCPTGRSSG